MPSYLQSRLHFPSYSALEDSNMPDSSQEDRHYILEIGNEHFGTLYIQDYFYSLTWNGLLNFDNLEKEFTSLLTHQTSKKLALQLSLYSFTPNTKRRPRKIVVSFFLEDIPDSYIECDLSIRSDFQTYKKIISRHQNISFVRYDVFRLDSKEQLHLQLSLTAENPDCQRMEASDSRRLDELSIMLPRTVPFTYDSLHWILEHNYKYPEFAKNINFNYSLNHIGQIIK